MRAHPCGQGAALVGRAVAGEAGRVTMTSLIGVSRIVDMITGEQLPRIC
jgi:hydrogenase expression/formation protein HypE